MEKNDDTYTITGKALGEGEWVKIKHPMDAEDEAWIQNHAATMVGKGRKARVNVTIGEIKLATLKRMILDWNLYKIEKDPINDTERRVSIPFSADAVNRLTQRVAGYINHCIDKLNPDWEDEEDEEDF